MAAYPPKNAETLTGEARVAFDRAARAVKLYYERGDLYRESSDIGRLFDAANVTEDKGILIGDLDPDEWGWVTITYVTATSEQDASSDDCAIAAIPGQRIELTIASDNTTRASIHDVKLRVRFDYSSREVRASITLTSNGKELTKRSSRAVTGGARVLLRYRDAQVYTSAVGHHIDARSATDSDVSIGDIPAGGQLFIRLIYDVSETHDTDRCSGSGSCRTCSADVPCRF